MGNKLVEAMSRLGTSSQEVGSDILILQFTIVNAFLVGEANNKDQEFVLVDTGLENSGDFIIESVEKRFGKGSRPQAIILTHGHFDHVGSAIKLSDYWDVPVYIHELELPYITGRKDYPLGDSRVGGMVAAMSPSFPHTSIDLGNRAKALPNDGNLPGMPDWRWIHTPGHSQGHISLFRERDRLLIIGDAFATTKQESLWSVLTQKEIVSGPPAYLTTDWDGALASIKKLKELKPDLLLTSHGKPMEGDEIDWHLDHLIREIHDMLMFP